MIRVLVAVGLFTSVLGAARSLPAAAQLDCAPCHGELELLRQHVATLDDARALNVSLQDLQASAHAETTCSGCHSGYKRFPHADDSSTQPCSECHAEEQASWSEGVHADDESADCAACHGVHDVRRVEEFEEGEGFTEIRGACEACHTEQSVVVGDPHADSVACADCHEPHETLSAAEALSQTHVLNQAATCGACHESIREQWVEDAHARAVPILAQPGVSRLDGATGHDPPACTGCHGAHSIVTAEGEGPDGSLSERCEHCHEDYAESFADSYHGQANALGSTEAATCYDCHSGHEVHPRDDDRSLVSDGRILETCQSCHAGATEGFTAFQPHADHNDAEKYPYVYWSYRLMTGLLICTFTFFGVHSGLWLTRSAIDGWRAAGAEASEDV